MKLDPKGLRNALFGLALVPLVASPALAIDARIRTQLQKLTPEERLEQRCDIEAMDQISKAKGGFRPDKVIAYAFGDPKLNGTTFKTKGGRVPQPRRMVPAVLQMRGEPRPPGGQRLQVQHRQGRAA